MNGDCFYWKPTCTHEELHSALALFADDYPVSDSGDGKVLKFRKISSGLYARKNEDGYEIGYSRPCEAWRALGAVFSGIVDSRELNEKPKMQTVGIMLDCSRNAVLTVDQVKKWLRRVALFGYNWVMLYTKDTYELPNEEFFGYLRGRYTAAELEEIDHYADKLGIQVVGCIQALGHLEPTLRWPEYAAIKDTSSVLLTTEQKSYELIAKMLDFYSSTCKSRRIHIGMDETHDLGRGRYLTLNGYRDAYEIYNDHLNKVAEMCRNRGLEPMIWSDMFFRLGCTSRSYYDPATVIPEHIRADIPKSVQLTYWDYYHENKEFYSDWIKRHRDLGFEPVMASAVWTWPVFWSDHEHSVKTFTPCIKACINEDVKEIIFTMWGDDGGYCDWDSALTGLCHAAELIYNNGAAPAPEVLEKRFAATCNADYKMHLTASEINLDYEKNVSSSAILWDDPLLGIYWKSLQARDDLDLIELENHFSAISEKLANCRKTGAAGDIKHATEVARALALKTRVANLLYDTYFSKDTDKAYGQVIDAAEEALSAINSLAKSFRKFWYERYKTFGFEVMQIRLSGQAARLEELITRLKDLDTARIESIPELDERALSARVNNKYRDVATAAYDF